MRANLIMKKLILTFILLAFLAPVLFAQKNKSVLAVTEMTFSGPGLSSEDLALLSDDIREKAMELTGYRLMMRDTITALLKAKKIDFLKCPELECELELGKTLQVDKLVTSNLLLKNGVYYLKIRLIDMSSGSAEKTVTRECNACDLSGLRKSVQDAAREIVGGLAGTPEKKEKAPGSAIPGGERPETKPTPAEVAPGVLTVEATPAKAKVTINGQYMGEAPFKVELQAGDYIVKMTADGYKPGEKYITVQPNRPTNLSFALEKETVPASPPPSQEMMNKTNNALTFYEWYNKGVRLNDNSDEEMAYYREAIRSDSSFAPPYYNLGLILYKRGMKQEAIENFEKYINYTKDPAEKTRVQEILDKIR